MINTYKCKNVKTKKRIMKGGNKDKPLGNYQPNQPKKLGQNTLKYYSNVELAKKQKSKINSLWHRLTRSRKNRIANKQRLDEIIAERRKSLISRPTSKILTFHNKLYNNNKFGESSTNQTSEEYKQTQAQIERDIKMNEGIAKYGQGWF
jgi:hypothetical protein